jgi:hypothetical protein
MWRRGLKISGELPMGYSMIIDDVGSEIEQAVEVMTEQLPRLGERNKVLQRLVESADVANAIAPNAWAVTLFADGFRLNVGPVEALVFLAGTLRVNLVGSVGVEPFVGPDFDSAGYRSLPQPLCAFVGSVGQYLAVAELLRQPHEQFVTLAAHSPSGEPRRGTPFHRYHCDGLMQYARRIAGTPSR